MSNEQSAIMKKIIEYGDDLVTQLESAEEFSSVELERLLALRDKAFEDLRSLGNIVIEKEGKLQDYLITLLRQNERIVQLMQQRQKELTSEMQKIIALQRFNVGSSNYISNQMGKHFDVES